MSILTTRQHQLLYVGGLAIFQNLLNIQENGKVNKKYSQISDLKDRSRNTTNYTDSISKNASTIFKSIKIEAEKKVFAENKYLVPQSFCRE